jgi:hypothetical protein
VHSGCIGRVEASTERSAVLLRRLICRTTPARCRAGRRCCTVRSLSPLSWARRFMPAMVKPVFWFSRRTIMVSNTLQRAQSLESRMALSLARDSRPKEGA